MIKTFQVFGWKSAGSNVIGYAHMVHLWPPSEVALLQARSKNKYVSKRQLYDVHSQVVNYLVLVSHSALFFCRLIYVPALLWLPIET